MALPAKSFSIQVRLLAATLLLLPLFLAVTTWMLDRSFINYQEREQAERMRLQQLLLARATEWDGQRWQVSDPGDARLRLVNSGLYAFLLSPQLELVWQSESADGGEEAFVASVIQLAASLGLGEVALGERRLQACELEASYYCQASRIAWGSSGPEAVFLVMESAAPMVEARVAYRNNLVLLYLVALVLLLLVQWLVIRWGLAPLRRISGLIERLKRGEDERLSNDFPSELKPITHNLNLLLDSEQRRRERVRNSMDRLAHVLKTPRMVLRNSSESGEAYRDLVQGQVDRMLDVVESGLARASLDGRAPDILGNRVEVKPVLDRIVDAYGRLPRPGHEEGVSIVSEAVEAGVDFLGETRDLQDLFGSLLENSLKYCESQVAVSAALEQASGRDWLVLAVEDDGSGIPSGLEREILKRGARADSANIGRFA